MVRMTGILGLAVAALLGATSLSGLSGTASAQAPAFSGEQKSAIQQIVKEYLIENPEVMKDVFAALEKKETELASAQQAKVLNEQGSTLQSADKSAVLGNPKGDVTLIEFVDYNCGYCRRAYKDTQSLIQADPKLRIVFREFPVLGPDSLEVAQISAQLHTHPKFAEFHGALFQKQGKIGKKEAIEVAKSLGIKTDDLEANMRSKDVVDRIEESHKLAASLNIGGTPTYVIGGEVIPGAVGAAALKKRIENMRQCGKTAC